MKLVTNIKEKLGQDYAFVLSECRTLDHDLNILLTTPGADQKEITFCRGKLVRKTQQLYELTNNLTQRNIIEQSIKNQLKGFNLHLRQRIKHQKTVQKYSITRELGLKRKMATTSFKQVFHSGDLGEGLTNLGLATKDTISASLTLAKYPAKLAIKILGHGGRLICKSFAVQGHLLVYPFYKVINPSGKYSGKTISKLGNGLEKVVVQIVTKTEDMIIRMWGLYGK